MTDDELFVRVMHRLADVFEEHAILKGGMALRLLDSPRSTTDLDYVFVPYRSKKEVRPLLEEALAGLEGASYSLSVHSTMIRADVELNGARIQIEGNVAERCASEPMATAPMARPAGHPSRVIRVMEFDVALAHKLAAWNERRLLRDLFDAHFLATRVGARPDMDTLDARLSQVRSRLPSHRTRKRMTRSELADALDRELEALDADQIEEELGPLLPREELAGLDRRLRARLTGLAESLRAGVDSA